MARSGERREEPEDDLPWLEPVGEQPVESTFVSSRKLVLGAILFVGLLAGILWGVRTLVSREEALQESAPVASIEDLPLIEAPPGPYKHRPADAGGLAVEGVDQTIYEAGGGIDPGGQIALKALPEEPLPRPAAGESLFAPTDGDPDVPETGPVELLPDEAGATEGRQLPPAGATPPSGPTASPTSTQRGPTGPIATPSKTVSQPAPPPALTADSGTSASGDGGRYALQLGAFSSQAKADAAWKRFSARFSYLAGLEKSVQKVQREGESLYRLRATGLSSRAQAEDLCGRLKVAGEACMVAN